MPARASDMYTRKRGNLNNFTGIRSRSNGLKS